MKLRQSMVCLGLSLAWVAACGPNAKQPIQSSPQSATVAINDPVQQQLLRDRATRYWTARVNGDWPSVYLFQDPPFRERVSAETFVAEASGEQMFRHHSFALGDVETMGDWGWVRVSSEMSLERLPGKPRRQQEKTEPWKRLGGEWYPCSSEEAEKMPEPPSVRDLAAERELGERFAAYASARKAKDYETIYASLNPADARELPFEEFKESESWFVFTAIDVQWTEVVGDRGRVGAVVTMRSNDPHLSKSPPAVKYIVEMWIRIDGVWYRDIEVQSR